jgi:hypothetical protein
MAPPTKLKNKRMGGLLSRLSLKSSSKDQVTDLAGAVNAATENAEMENNNNNNTAAEESEQQPVSTEVPPSHAVEQEPVHEIAEPSQAAATSSQVQTSVATTTNKPIDNSQNDKRRAALQNKNNDAMARLKASNPALQAKLQEQERKMEEEKRKMAEARAKKEAAKKVKVTPPPDDNREKNVSVVVDNDDDDEPIEVFEPSSPSHGPDDDVDAVDDGNDNDESQLETEESTMVDASSSSNQEPSFVTESFIDPSNIEEPSYVEDSYSGSGHLEDASMYVVAYDFAASDDDQIRLVHNTYVMLLSFFFQTFVCLNSPHNEIMP